MKLLILSSGTLLNPSDIKNFTKRKGARNRTFLFSAICIPECAVTLYGTYYY